MHKVMVSPLRRATPNHCLLRRDVSRQLVTAGGAEGNPAGPIRQFVLKNQIEPAAQRHPKGQRSRHKAEQLERSQIQLLAIIGCQRSRDASENDFREWPMPYIHCETA